jgi:TctA family transporter
VPIFGLSATIGSIFNFGEHDAKLFLSVLAVSWDALWSGPAKAAQATAGNWNDYQVVLSFAIAGVVVALVAELALTLTKRLRRKHFDNPYTLARNNIIGKFFELSVIGGFGILSLWHAFSDTATLYQSISVAALILIVAFVILKKSIKETQLTEAQTSCRT